MNPENVFCLFWWRLARFVKHTFRRCVSSFSIVSKGKHGMKGIRVKGNKYRLNKTGGEKRAAARLLCRVRDFDANKLTG